MSAFVVYAGSGLSTIDAKGRVTIPAELRDTVAESSGENIVCISRHPNLPCLIGYGRAERQKQDLRLHHDALLRSGLRGAVCPAVGGGCNRDRAMTP